jgi:glycosyltransferase involved in cell wall biosynthesis
MERRIKIFTWHVHGSYLFYLSQGNFEIFIPYKNDESNGYIGRGSTFPFGENVRQVPVEQVRELAFDCILFQGPANFLTDQYEIFNEAQRALPKIYLEHDPPQSVPTDTQHVVNDENVLVIHVTHFNKLMWNNGLVQTEVIDHGIIPSVKSYSGDIESGIVVINNLSQRGRRLGLDIFEHVRRYVPLDLIGIGAEKVGGIGEILHPQLPDFIRRYRFFFNPIRYTSLGLAVLEAMMLGIPVVGLATTEMVTVVENGKSGIIHTNIEYLIEKMKMLLADRGEATRLGLAGRQVVMNRFHIQRFVDDWSRVFNSVIKKRLQKAA